MRSSIALEGIELEFKTVDLGFGGFFGRSSMRHNVQGAVVKNSKYFIGIRLLSRALYRGTDAGM